MRRRQRLPSAGVCWGRQPNVAATAAARQLPGSPPLITTGPPAMLWRQKPVLQGSGRYLRLPPPSALGSHQLHPTSSLLP